MKAGHVTLNTLKISNVFLQASSTCVFTGYGLSKTLRIDNSQVWETLRKMEMMGWLVSQFESTFSPGRPPKRLYSMTEKGRESATTHLSPFQLRSA